MYNLDVPDVDDMSLFDTCIAVKPRALRQSFDSVRAEVQAAYDDYEVRANFDLLVGTASILPFADGLPTEPNFRQLYAGQVLDKRGPARSVYDKILLAARRCPFCSHNKPRSLDHFLPKETFAEYSIFSKNLVPCCRDCNSEKHTKVISADEQFLHPYFDQIGDDTWLECFLDYTDGAPAYCFYVDMSAVGISGAVLAKLQYQFCKLGLNDIYSTKAIDEVEGQLRYLRRLHQTGGTDEVWEFLAEQATSKTDNNANSWQSALYRGLVSDPEFASMQWDV